MKMRIKMLNLKFRPLRERRGRNKGGGEETGPGPNDGQRPGPAQPELGMRGAAWFPPPPLLLSLSPSIPPHSISLFSHTHFSSHHTTNTTAFSLSLSPIFLPLSRSSVNLRFWAVLVGLGRGRGGGSLSLGVRKAVGGGQCGCTT